MEKEGVANSLSDLEKAAIEDLRRPTESILNQLKPEIDSGTYGVIIGDDATGRLPAFLLWKTLGIVFEKRGRQRPLLRFIAGSTRLRREPREYDSKKEILEHHLGQMKHEMNSREASNQQKALIVTDTIDTGESVRMLMNGIYAHNWSADIATIGFLGSAELEHEFKSKIAVGSTKLPKLYVYGRNLSGVSKDKSKLFSSLRRESPYMVSLEKSLDPNFVSKIYNHKVRDARKLIDALAQELAEKFLQTGK